MLSQKVTPSGIKSGIVQVGIFLSLLLFCLLIYHNSLHNEFLMDDHPRLLNNAEIRQFGFDPFNLKTLKTQIYLRPVTDFFNFITWMFFERDPSAYHLTNIFIFALAAHSIYRLLILLFQSKHIAYITALIFCAHPINSICVNYKNATSFPFIILAVCLSLINYIYFIDKKKPIFSFLFSIIWFILAIFSHEIVVAFPLYCFAAIYFSSKCTFKKSVILTLPFIFLTGVFIVARSFLLSKQANVYGYIDSFNISVMGYIANFTKLFSWHVTKLISLKGIVLAWDTPIDNNPAIIWPIIFISIVILSIYIVFSRKTSSILKFALAWIVIGFLPVSLACFSRPFLGFVIQPHWVFFSSIGYFVILAFILTRPPKTLSVLFTLILLVIFSISTRHYNHLWGTEPRYCQYWLSISRHNFWPNFWLGYYYLEKDDYTRAKSYFLKISQTPFKQKEIKGNLGIIELKQKEYHLAEKYFLDLLKMEPNDAQTHYYLGEIYYLLNQHKKAEYFLINAINLDPYLINPKERLIQIMQQTNRTHEAAALTKDVEMLRKIKK